MFSGCTVPSVIKEMHFGSSNLDVFGSVAKNTEAVLVQCRTWKCVLTAIFSGVDNFEAPGCHLLQQISSQ